MFYTILVSPTAKPSVLDVESIQQDANRREHTRTGALGLDIGNCTGIMTPTVRSGPRGLASAAGGCGSYTGTGVGPEAPTRGRPKTAWRHQADASIRGAVDVVGRAAPNIWTTLLFGLLLIRPRSACAISSL